MSDHDIQLLSLGAAFGMNFMLLVHIAFGVLDDRRDRRTAQASRARLDKREATRNWRDALTVRESA